MNKSIILLVSIILVLFSSCAQAIPIQECIVNEPYGFWYGLWHGMIILFSFIGSFFNDDIVIYAVNNTGTWYDFGFVLEIEAVIGR